MKKIFVVIITLVVTCVATVKSFGQNTEEILAEGKLLHRLERASWFGSDIFTRQFSHLMSAAGGYLSYVNEENRVVNLFFGKDHPHAIIARFEFEEFPQPRPTVIDAQRRDATPYEMDLITIRQDALQRVSNNEDGFFSFYENANPNPIPLIKDGEKKVFILTGPTVSNVVLLGNDYLLTYNKKNELVKKEKLHNSIIRFPYKSDDPENPIQSTTHSHALSDIITSTDICTLLLYKDFVEWRQHYVFSKRYVSIFDLDKEALVVLKRKAWDKMNIRQKEQQKN